MKTGCRTGLKGRALRVAGVVDCAGASDVHVFRAYVLEQGRYPGTGTRALASPTPCGLAPLPADSPRKLDPPQNPTRTTASHHPVDSTPKGLPDAPAEGPDPTNGKRALSRIEPQVRKCRPRTRGGGPRRRCRVRSRLMSSPHARGWSLLHRGQLRCGGVVPARAGVVRNRRHISRPRCGRPRTRGGGPVPGQRYERAKESSPHARGWSDRPGGRDVVRDVVPARAGVVRRGRRPGRRVRCRPRTRGGGPGTGHAVAFLGGSSPHAGVVPTGQSQAEMTDGGPRICGGGPILAASQCGGSRWSPRLRGCSEVRRVHAGACEVVPAIAGVWSSAAGGELAFASGPVGRSGV